MKGHHKQQFLETADVEGRGFVHTTIVKFLGSFGEF